MSASTPMVARDINHRRRNHSTASVTPTPIAASPRIHSPRWSWWRTGPSMTALVMSGIETVATRLTTAMVSMAIHRTRYGKI